MIRLNYLTILSYALTPRPSANTLPLPRRRMWRGRLAEVSEAAIFCARCGAAGQKVESYCRSCGEWLPDPAPAKKGGKR